MGKSKWKTWKTNSIWVKSKEIFSFLYSNIPNLSRKIDKRIRLFWHPKPTYTDYLQVQEKLGDWSNKTYIEPLKRESAPKKSFVKLNAIQTEFVAYSKKLGMRNVQWREGWPILHMR